MVVFRTRDPRLNRKLSIAKFVLSFGIYIDVICASSPGRREAFNLYLHKVVDLAHKYSSSTFYDYHRSFSAKIAALGRSFS